jgi:hypothetical protein
VDEALSESDRQFLSKLVKQRERSYILTYSGSVNYTGLDWLSPFIQKTTRNVITTNLDDDDGVSSGFTRYINQYLTTLTISGGVLPILFMASKYVDVWDFFSTDEAPVDYMKPGIRQKFCLQRKGNPLC